MENFEIINVWIEYYYFLTATLETSFFWQEFCYKKKTDLGRFSKNTHKNTQLLDLSPN